MCPRWSLCRSCRMSPPAPSLPRVATVPIRRASVRARHQRKRNEMANFPFQRRQSDLSMLIAKTTAGDRLPSEPDLARSLGVSRATLREAMRTFEAQGLSRRRQGSGTFVVGQMPVIEAGLELLESLETMAERLGLEVTVSDLHIETVSADEESAQDLGVSANTRLTRVRRVMREETRPVAYL